jgi:superfamily II DNA or RNA helicase
MCEALSIPNLVKAKAKKMDEWGWEKLPDYIELYEFDTNGDEETRLVMPRGFLERFMVGMEAFGGEIVLKEGRCWRSVFRIGDKVDLRRWQVPQIETLRSWEQGILKAPAGSGKTVTMLALIQMLACKSIVIVNTKDIIWQWQERARTFLGEHYPVGQIGDGKFDVSPYLTIATAQTLNSRFDELEEQGFFDSFSFVCLDECHHATAETYNKILNRFSSRFRFGVSATPDKTGDFELAVNVLGPIIHVTHPHDVDTLTKPKVVRVPTKFGYGFRGHKNRWQRSNYGDMIKALISNPERNRLIIDVIKANAGHHQLLVTKRLEHIQILEDLLLDEGWDEALVRLTGKDSNEHRDEAVALIGSTPGLMLSTLADEALDIPRLDRIILPFPQKNTGLVTQQVGRVERIADGKADAIIFDIVDGNVGVLHSQWKARRFEVYEARGYKIETWRTEP